MYIADVWIHSETLYLLEILVDMCVGQTGSWPRYEWVIVMSVKESCQIVSVLSVFVLYSPPKK